MLTQRSCTLNMLKNFLISCLACLLPIKAMMVTVFILTIADLILGIWAAKKRGEKITSAGLGRTVSKLVIYQVGLILGFLTQHYLLGDTIPLINIISGLIGTTELLSCTENMDTVYGTPIFGKLIQMLSSKNDAATIKKIDRVESNESDAN